MKAVAVFPAKHDVSIVDHPEPPEPTGDQVALRVLDVGICGTDREICAFHYGTPPSGSEHLVIGHESLAEVTEIGPEVRSVMRGDLAVVMVRRPCPHADCPACRHDRQDFCFTGDFTERGIKGAHGFMTERVIDREKYVVPVPRELRHVGVLVEPLTIAEKALIQVWDVQERLPWTLRGGAGGPGEGRHAVVLGGGPVGLLGAMALVARGFDTFVYSLEPETGPKAQVTRAIGATYISAKGVDTADLARKMGTIDLVYEATGAADVSFRLLEHLGTNGVFIFTGVPGRKAPIQFNAAAVMQNLVLRNQIVYGTVNAGRDAFEAAIRDLGNFVKRWPDAVDRLVTRRHPPEAFRELLLERPEGIKHILSFVSP